MRITWTCDECRKRIAIEEPGWLWARFSEIRDPEARVTWHVTHERCADREALDDSYAISTTYRADTAKGLVDCTEHLMTKTWFGRSNWMALSYRALEYIAAHR